MIKRSAAIAGAVGALLLGAPSIAHAASPMTPTAATALSCTEGGSSIGSGSTALQNGTLTSSFCAFDNHGISTVLDSYKRTGGSGSIKVCFTWEFTSSSGGDSDNRQPCTYVTIATGQTGSAQGNYPSPGKQAKSGNDGCVRGVMVATGETYTTRVVCY